MKCITYCGKHILVRKEIAAAISKSKKKMRYQEKHKRDHFEIDMENETVRVIPSREDSYDRLLDEKLLGFSAECESVDNIAFQKMLREELQIVINQLSVADQHLIRLLFWDDLSEKNAAEMLKITQQAINKRKKRILRKLKRILETTENGLLKSFLIGLSI